MTTTLPNPDVVPTVATVEGSKFPDRIQVRQDFQQQEQVIVIRLFFCSSID